ncbi:MAG: maltose ABC transporter permease MalF [Halothermotrichaceae bacterium]
MKNINQAVIKNLMKISIFAVLDAVAVWAGITLFTQQLYKLLFMLILGIVFINIIYLSKKTYPLRYILPGTLFMLMLIVYPLFYTFYVSLTNYGTGHVLSKEQVITQLEGRYYLPEKPELLKYIVLKSGESLIILFKDEQGKLLLGKDQNIIEISSDDYRLVDSDGDGIIDKYNNYKRVNQKNIFKHLSKLQQLEFDYNNKIIKMKNLSEFALYLQQYKYIADKDVIINLKTGYEYIPGEGTFIAENGEKLLPGFRTYLGWDNFLKIINDKRISGPFIRVFVWTLIWAFISVISTFGLGLLLAILLNDKYLKFKKIYRILLILPYAIPAFISAMVWHGLFDTEVGVINTILESIFGSGLPWLIDPFWARVAVIIVNLWLGFPYMMIIALGALQSIPDSYYEAAAIDGASIWQQFRYITFPLLLVSMGPLLISSFAFNFNNFNVIYLFNRGRPAIPNAQTPAGATDILISYTYRLSFESGQGSDFGLASAVTIFIFLLTALITWFNFRYTGALEEVKESV